MAQAREIEAAVLSALKQDGPSTMDELVRRVPGFTWIQVFAAVDRLHDQGKVVLRPLTPYDYLVSLGTGDKERSPPPPGEDEGEEGEE